MNLSPLYQTRIKTHKDIPSMDSKKSKIVYLKLLWIVIALASITGLRAQQVFKPVIIDLVVGSHTYTVPTDSILKVESIGYRTSNFIHLSDWRLTINGKTIWISDQFNNSHFEHKVPFWLPSNTVLSLPNNSSQYGTYQIYGLLFPE